MLQRVAVVGLALVFSACATSHTPDGGASDGGWDSSVRPDATALDASPDCSIVGNFDATIDGFAITFHFRADDTWNASVGGMLEPFTARYTFDGVTFGIYNPDGDTAPGCGPESLGIYTLAFGADCSSVTLTLVRDACPDRASSLAGLTMTRVR